MRFKNIKTFFYIALSAGLVFRFFQQIYTIDSVTGFFKPAYKNIGIILVGVVFLIAISMAAVCLFIRRCPLKLPKVNHTAGSFALALALAILFNVGTVSPSLTVPAWQTSLLKAKGVLAAAFFIAVFVKCFKNYKIPALLFATPVLYYLVRLIYTFTATSTISLISDTLYELAAQIFSLLFMLEYALLANNLSGESGYKKIAATGFSAVILCCVASVPPLVTYFANRSLAIRVDFSSSLVTLTTACFIYCFLRSHFSGRNLKRRRKHTHRHSHFNGDDTDKFYMG